MPTKRTDRPSRQRRAPADAPAPGKVYGYCRVSTLAQADEGLSLDVQQRQIEGYAQMHGLEIARTFVERGISGSRPLDERPQGKALLALLKPRDAVITPKLDRMFRSAQNALNVLGELKQRGVSLHMLDLGGDVTGNGVSKLVFTILSAVAENERERTRERVTETKADQRKQGRYLGGKLPFGYRVGDDGALIEIPEQQQAIRRMKQLKARGWSLRTIASVVTKDGFPISYVGVRDILARTA